MNGFEKEYTLHVRVSKNEIINYKKLASEMGMNISTMTRFVLNKEVRLMEDEIMKENINIKLMLFRRKD